MSDCKTLVGPKQSIIAKAIIGLKDDEGVKKSSTILSEVTWKINQLLTPESLKTTDLREIKRLFLKTSLRYIGSVKHEESSNQINSKINRMENKAIGGGWI